MASKNFVSSFIVESFVTKRWKVKEKSITLGHKGLGHNSKERVERLTKENIIHSLNFDDISTCVDCIKGKFTKPKEKVKLEGMNS